MARKCCSILVFLALFSFYGCQIQEYNYCDLNGVACHGETAFSICQDGQPTYDMIFCPENYLCTNGPRICYRSEEVNPAYIASRIAVNIHEPVNEDYTSDERETLSKSPASPEATNEVLKIIESLDALCTENNNAGPLLNPYDSTCETFIYCLKRADAWLGFKKNCPFNQYFNPDGYCSAEKPENCD